MTEVTWITGASSGIGRALALRLAGPGRHVVASARSADELALLAAEAPGRIEPLPLDVTDHHAVLAAIERIETGIGPVTTAVLSAGTHRPVDAAAFKLAELKQLVALNVFGVASCLEGLMPRMMARRAGRIAVVASVAGYRGLPTAAYYGATKAALINMVESLKFDLDRSGVTIQLVNPGFVRTPLTDRNDFPMPFLIEAEDAAARLARGLEASSFEIAFPRRFVAIMKLLRLLPYSLFFPLVARGTRR